MALEKAIYLDKLDESNPDGNTDFISQGDDHIRLIKKTLKNTFPNITGAITYSDTELNALKTNVFIDDGKIDVNGNQLLNVSLNNAVPFWAGQPRIYNDSRYFLVDTTRDNGLFLINNGSVLSFIDSGTLLNLMKIDDTNTVIFGEPLNKRNTNIIGTDIIIDIPTGGQLLVTKGGTEANFLDWVYPIGVIYESTSPNNPSVDMGWVESTWITHSPGRVLVGEGDTGDLLLENTTPDEYFIGDEFGEYNHFILYSEMPTHDHDYNFLPQSKTTGDGNNGGEAVDYAPDSIDISGLTGESNAHNNMQPYTTVYRWVRTV